MILGKPYEELERWITESHGYKKIEKKCIRGRRARESINIPTDQRTTEPAELLDVPIRKHAQFKCSIFPCSIATCKVRVNTAVRHWKKVIIPVQKDPRDECWPASQGASLPVSGGRSSTGNGRSTASVRAN